jgi:glucosamine-6-phosphate deaminase
MCLPSGLTPNPLYAEMVASVLKGQVSFARASIWVLDEFGGVPRDDPGRCVNMLRRNLVSEIDLPAEGFHFLEPEDPDIDEQCRRFEPRDGFELVLLGLGTNGHLGMNEPGSSADSPTRRVELHASTIEGSARYFSHGRLPDWGVTVGLDAIGRASEVWLLASGESKAEIARRTVRGKISDEVPASLLRRHPNCSLFVDMAAASLL